MSRLRIESLSLQGFRAYGAETQTLNLGPNLTAIWAPNSKGKTSLAEAMEFLLTGSIVRRELTTSTTEEFSDALRNAHLASENEVFVSAALTSPDGTRHEIKRELTQDYGKRQNCESILTIDDQVGDQADLERLGFTFSQPPLNVPVLAQHTLAYIFSVRPQDRSTYFKALLEVTDLEDLRNSIDQLSKTTTVPENPLLSRLTAVKSIEAIAAYLETLEANLRNINEFRNSISGAAALLIEAGGEAPPDSDQERLELIGNLLEAERNRAFPTRLFDCGQFSERSGPEDAIWSHFSTYLEEREKVDNETRKLLKLYNEVLALPDLANLEQSVDCPVCESDQSLSPARVQKIRRHVEESRDFERADARAKSTLADLENLARSLENESQTVIPQFLSINAGRRKQEGFRVERIRQLLGDDQIPAIQAWLRTIAPLLRTTRTLRKEAKNYVALIAEQKRRLDEIDVGALKAGISALMQIREHALQAANDYYDAAKPLLEALNAALDAGSNTSGWQDFLEIYSNPESLRTAMVEQMVASSASDDIQHALRELDRAKEKVLDDKFSDHSALVKDWWDRLRPDEPAFFREVKPRKGARRTIDLKVGLAIGPDQTNAKLRDAIAVFSQSQIHCLGLALFLAKVEREAAGFVVMDDPVLSSDEDYRVHFNTTVISELLAKGIQVIILTQDHDTFEELETRYRHVSMAGAQIHIESPEEGSLIDNTSDTLLAKISRARSLARGGHPDSRKECGIHLRDAGERFCKELLVTDRQSKGEAEARLDNYDGKTLDWLVPRVQPLLDRDPSHSGKLEAFKSSVNDACHDNAPPSSGAMTSACGEIHHLQKVYLPR